MTNTKTIAFEDALDEDDFGLIIGKDGSLKGMFVPTEYEDEDYIPKSEEEEEEDISDHNEDEDLEEDSNDY